MFKTRRILLCSIAVIAIEFLFFNSLHAASLTYDHGYLYSKSDAYAFLEGYDPADPAASIDYTTSGYIDTEVVAGDFLPDEESSDDVEAGGYGQAAYGEGAYIGDSYYENGVYVGVYGFSYGYSSFDSGSLSASGLGSTIKSSNYDGIYFKIEAGEDEVIGDDVAIYLSWYAELIGLGGTATLNGGDGNDFSVSLNSSTVWSHTEILDDGNSLSSYSEEDFFIAQIGDTIGIHMTAKAEIELKESVAYLGDTEVLSIIDLAVGTSPVPVPGAIWLLGSSLFGILGIRSSRKSC